MVNKPDQFWDANLFLEISFSHKKYFESPEEKKKKKKLKTKTFISSKAKTKFSMSKHDLKRILYKGMKEKRDTFVVAKYDK